MTSEKRVWITGAGKGIGRAVALKLAEDGWRVAASARTRADLDALEREAPAGRIVGYPLDVTDIEATRRVVGEMERTLGLPDTVILNAGTHKPTPADNFSIADVRTLVETNLMGTANGLAEIMPRFMARGSGHIAVVASLAGYRGLPTSAGYGASKAALINMCEALKPELDKHGVTLTLINPGFVKTPLTDKNTFPMPFLVSAEEAATRIVRGLSATAFEVTFPTRFAWLMKGLRALPDRLFFAVTRRMIDP